MSAALKGCGARAKRLEAAAELLTSFERRQRFNVINNLVGILGFLPYWAVFGL